LGGDVEVGGDVEAGDGVEDDLLDAVAGAVECSGDAGIEGGAGLGETAYEVEHFGADFFGGLEEGQEEKEGRHGA